MPDNNDNGYGYTIQPGGQPGGNQPPGYPHPGQMLQIPSKMVDASSIYTISQARLNESRLLLNGMEEIRSALNMAKVGEGDGGATERPPLKPAFDDVNLGLLQQRYLFMVDQYISYTEHFLKKYPMEPFIYPIEAARRAKMVDESKKVV